MKKKSTHWADALRAEEREHRHEETYDEAESVVVHVLSIEAAQRLMDRYAGQVAVDGSPVVPRVFEWTIVPGPGTLQ